MKTITQETEKRLKEALHKIASYVEDGDHPTDAVVKAAREMDMPRGHVPFVCRAYNISSVNTQRQNSESALEKFAELELADPEEAQKKLFPDHIPAPSDFRNKSAVSADYTKPPVWLEQRKRAEIRKKVLPPIQGTSKSAFLVSREPPAPFDVARRRQWVEAQEKMAQLKRAHAEARREYQATEDQFRRDLDRLSEYFQKAAYTRLPLADVEYNSRAMFGDLVIPLFDVVVGRGHFREKRASTAPKVIRPVSTHQPPYVLVKHALAGAAAVNASHAKLEAASEALEKTGAVLMAPFQLPPQSADWTLLDSVGKPPELEKEAISGMFGGALAGLGSNLLSGQDTNSLLDSKVNALSDPQHESELQKIHVQAMLQDLMANDPEISGHEPDEVMNAYNELAGTVPSAAANGAIMGPLLRRRLMGQMEPFEAGELTKLETGLRSQHQSPKPAFSPSHK